MSNPSDHLREIYEKRGELEYGEAPGSPDRDDRKFQRIAARISAYLPRQALLDGGCGDGRHLAALPALGPVPARVVGVDIADSILRTAGVATRAAGVDAELIRANLEELPFRDGSFDFVLCTQTIEHVLEPTLALRELRRILQPGGVLVISTDNSRNIVSRVLNAPRAGIVRLLGMQGRRLKVEFPHATFEPKAFVALLESVGFNVISVETFRFHLIGAPRLVRRLLNRLDARLPGHAFGDLLLVEARV